MPACTGPYRRRRWPCPSTWRRTFSDDYPYFYAESIDDEHSDSDTSEILRVLDLPPGSRILDAPCGHGRIARRLGAAGMDVTGVDVTPAYIEEARADPLLVPGTVDVRRRRHAPAAGRRALRRRRVLAEFVRLLRRRRLPPGAGASSTGSSVPGARRHRDAAPRRRRAPLHPGPRRVAVEAGDDTMIELWTFDPVTGRMVHRAHRPPGRGDPARAPTSCGCPRRPNGSSGSRRPGSATCGSRPAAAGPSRSTAGRWWSWPPPEDRREAPGRNRAATLRDGAPSARVVGPTGRSGRTAVMTAGIAAWGTYLPYWRLQRSAIGRCWAVAAAGAPAPWRPTTRTRRRWAWRRVAGRWRSGPGAVAVQDLFLSTPDPGYLDKTSATTVHAALGLPRACGAYDFAGSSRSAVATLLQALVGRGGAGRAHDDGRGLGPAHRPGGLRRGARQRRRRRGIRVRARRRRGRAHRAGRGERRVPRPLARARARPTRTSGRSASARRSTSRWPARRSPPH